jgi:hypothetical protein
MSIINVRKLSFSWVTALWKAVDIRDFFIFGGLGMLGYGLWMFIPWLGFAVPGAILLCFGLFVGKRGG